MKTTLSNVLEILIGFSSGLMIGAGFIALMTVLGVIPRLIQLSKTTRLVHLFGAATILGALFGTLLSFTKLTWQTGNLFLILWGVMQGIFNGMVAAALTEILNVFPILAKRISIEKHLYWLLMALVFGKIFGSLFQWLVLVK